MTITLRQVGEILLGPEASACLTAEPLADATADSRECRPGSLFFALEGANTDGHAYVDDAIARGAVAAVVRHDWAALPGGEPGRPRPHRGAMLIPVERPLEALQHLAGRWRRRLSATVIGVTGSVGKTVTREVVATVLERRHRVHRSRRNFNSEIGLPLSVLAMEEGHSHAVLEMGMYGLGEIALLAHITLPAIGVVTNVGPTHLERLGSLERTAQAKSELVAALPPEGTAVLNGDDARVRAMAGVARCPVVTYGFDEANDLRAVDYLSRGLEGSEFTAVWAGESRRLPCPMPGRHSVYAALAAVAVGRRCGLGWGEIEAGLEATAGCSRLKCLMAGDVRILDDSYNSAPASAAGALEVLSRCPGRRIAVLGDMLELGSEAEAGHREVGRRAAAAADALITVGGQGRWTAEEAARAGMAEAAVVAAADHEQALAALRSLVRPGDTVLVKGSRGMRMEALLESLVQLLTISQSG